jgi:ubiquitin carboxyl-terminal hydrolase 34
MFEEMLTSFARLILNLVELDRLTLEKLPADSQDIPDLISPYYINLLEDMLSWKDNTHCPVPSLYTLLYRTYNTNYGVLVRNLANVVCDSPMNGITRLTSLARQILRVTPKPDKTHFMVLVRMCGVMCNILNSRYRSHTDRLMLIQEGHAPAMVLQRTKLVHEFIQLMDPCYQESILKLNPNLSAEFNRIILETISECLFVIGESNPKVLAHIIDEYKIDITDAELPHQPTIVKHSWIFHRLHQCITKARMELRAQAVDIMQDKLVSVFHAHIKGNQDQAMAHPLVRYLVNFIREVKIIDYIIGVESHPQLMGRSANIIGFLLVTNEYKDEDTDKMWQVIMESEDPRAISAILQMLDSFFRTSDLEPVLYLASKLLDVPIRRFDKDFTEFAHNLLSHIIRKYQAESHICPDMLIFKVCIRMLRESISSTELESERKMHLQGCARRHLEVLVQWPVPDSDKFELYSSCVRDIEEKNEHATSGMRTINSLLVGKLHDDIGDICAQFDFTRLCVEELAHFATSDKLQNSQASLEAACFCDRVEILNRIIMTIPETLTADLGQTLWDTLYASSNLPPIFYDHAWSRFTLLIKHLIRIQEPNPFLNRCMNEFLPKLSPLIFNNHVLTFSMETIKYEIQLDPPPPPQEGDTVAIPSVERLWNILINSPSTQIAASASDNIVELYLDNKLIRNAPRSAAEATHVALVDECVSRLTTAAASLKSFSDGTMSGEDEPMVIIVPESETKLEERRFSRSLLFLKEFLQGLRKRPQYCSFSLQDRQQKGQLIDLKYECYDGPEQKQRRTLQIGDLETLRDLKDRLIDASGFSNLQVICGAIGKIDFAASPTQTIRERKLEKAGLLLVRNAEPGVRAPKPIRRQSLPLVDSEILKHFEELYDLLDLEDRFSKEVFLPSRFIISLICARFMTFCSCSPRNQESESWFRIQRIRILRSSPPTNRSRFCSRSML